jgi:UDP-glucose 4-epimerase
MSRVVMVTGVSRYLGGRMAAQLAADPRISSVIGVDVVPPATVPEGVEFVRADIRNPIIAKVMGAQSVDTVVHMGVIATPKQAGGRSVMKEINVIGTMQLLAACQQTESLENVIVKSTAMVYGSGPKDPALFTEDMDPRHAPKSGWAKDSIEVEHYVRGFARRRPHVRVTTFRFANFIGPHVQTAMTAYFELPVIPTVLGFDARVQFIAEDDGLDVIHHSVHDPIAGTFNIAGDGVLMLSQAIRQLGRPQIPVPQSLLSTFGKTIGSRPDFSPEHVRYLAFGRALDTSAARTKLGWQPELSSAEAFAGYSRARHPHAPVKAVSHG